MFRRTVSTRLFGVPTFLKVVRRVASASTPSVRGFIDRRVVPAPMFSLTGDLAATIDRTVDNSRFRALFPVVQFIRLHPLFFFCGGFTATLGLIAWVFRRGTKISEKVTLYKEEVKEVIATKTTRIVGADNNSVTVVTEDITQTRTRELFVAEDATLDQNGLPILEPQHLEFTFGERFMLCLASIFFQFYLCSYIRFNAYCRRFREGKFIIAGKRAYLPKAITAKDMRVACGTSNNSTLFSFSALLSTVMAGIVFSNNVNSKGDVDPEARIPLVILVTIAVNAGLRGAALELSGTTRKLELEWLNNEALVWSDPDAPIVDDGTSKSVVVVA